MTEEAGYDPARDLVHGHGWNTAARWGGWSWDAPRDGEWFRTCSFCGCIHPEDLAAELPDVSLHWADMKYGWPHKLYADLPSREPDRLHVVSAGHANAEGLTPFTGMMPALRWVRPDQIPEGTVTAGWLDLSRYDVVGLGPKPVVTAKFYTVHLRDTQVEQEPKDAIGQASGLRITWLDDDGHVAWERWT